MIRGVDRVESCTKSSLSVLSAAQNLVKSTIFKGLTNKSNPDRIKTINTNKGQLYMMYTKELIFSEFKEVTKKDEKYKKPTYTNRIAYLTALKEDMIKVPKNFSNISITPEQLQNTIDCWSAPNPRDAFYKSVFGMTYAEKKQQEELEYFIYENGEKKEVRKSKQETQSIH